MHRSILRIAIPCIVSNITVPLLSLVDTTLAGHLGAASYIGAVALGGMVFNMTYWLFGFLRMGTGGLTAQAYGASRTDEALRVLGRALSVGAIMAAAMLLLQAPIIDLIFSCVSTTAEIEAHARTYYNILIWGAPAVLGLYAFAGWFLGMQNAKYPMYIALVQNAVNIAISLALVRGLGWHIEGIAWGTLVAQYSGLIMAVMLWRCRYASLAIGVRLGGVRALLSHGAFTHFFSVNRDIFLRTLCLISVSTYFTAAGAAQGELALAANALLMQFFVLFSYVMDGFAYAGEALGGRYFGARDRLCFTRLTRSLFVWGGMLGVCFTLIYIGAGQGLISLLSDSPQVRQTAGEYLPFACAIPLISLTAFLLDGLFIGTTSTRLMLLSMAVAVLSFFLLIALLPTTNSMLWVAFLTYLGSRGAVQGCVWEKVMHKFETSYAKKQ